MAMQNLSLIYLSRKLFCLLAGFSVCNKNHIRWHDSYMLKEEEQKKEGQNFSAGGHF